MMVKPVHEHSPPVAAWKVEDGIDALPGGYHMYITYSYHPSQ